MKTDKVRSGSIPQFGLYGETSLPTADVSIEDIAARSRQYDWQIKPHRHGKLLQLLCLFDGTMEVLLDEANHTLSGNWVVTVPPGCVHGFRFPADTQGVVLSVGGSLLADADRQPFQPYAAPLLQNPLLIQFDKGDALFMQLRQYLDMIRLERLHMGAGHTLMLAWQVNMVLMTLRRQLDRCEAPPSSQRSSHLLVSFRSLLDSHYREAWTVQDYAAALHMSASSLNRLCQQTTGSGAKALIQERVLLEAKRRLIYTQEPLDRIAYLLGFKDPAYFSRFFKKLAGTPPSDYRKAKSA